jgi:hypothetical protein
MCNVRILNSQSQFALHSSFDNPQHRRRFRIFGLEPGFELSRFDYDAFEGHQRWLASSPTLAFLRCERRAHHQSEIAGHFLDL